jgi:hypothetical protein
MSKNCNVLHEPTLLVAGSKQSKREAKYLFHLVSSFKNACKYPYFTRCTVWTKGETFTFARTSVKFKETFLK